jgi:hypothetical protein
MNTPHGDPARAEMIFWVNIMYENWTVEEQARRFIELYGYTDYDEAEIIKALTAFCLIKIIC